MDKNVTKMGGEFLPHLVNLANVLVLIMLLTRVLTMLSCLGSAYLPFFEFGHQHVEVYIYPLLAQMPLTRELCLLCWIARA
jgi:hypothetical protein